MLTCSTTLCANRVAPIAAQSTCNGHAEFCDRLYSNVSVIGAHNSYGVSKGNRACLRANFDCAEALC